jgi:hypothetical protein
MPAASWISENWFSLIQSLGIVLGLWFTMGSFRQATDSSRDEAKAREIGNILAITVAHRALWGEASKREGLSRLFKERLDCVEPISIEEEEFLNLVFVHYEMGWQMAEGGSVLTPQTLAKDIKGFLSLPLPYAVWNKTKETRNARFVEFVERALKV